MASGRPDARVHRRRNLGIAVSPVEKYADRRAFLDVPDRIYAKVPEWIAPLSPVRRRTSEPRRNPFHRDATIGHFVSRDEAGHAVGRIATSIHPPYIDRHGPRAFFAFFETVDDHRVAKALLGAAEAWASVRGMKTLLGPLQLHDGEVGMLVDGFDRFRVSSAHNPPYRDLMNACVRPFAAATCSATRKRKGNFPYRNTLIVLKRKGSGSLGR